MNKLEQLIQELCPNGVEYGSIGSIIVREKNKASNQSKKLPVYVISNNRGIIPNSEYREQSLASEDTSNYWVIKHNMFAYNPSRLNIGSIGYLKENVCGILSPLYVVFCVNEKKMMVQFFNYLLRSTFVKNKINNYKEEGARFRFDFERWNKIFIPIPPLEIQKEIVRILDKFTDLEKELEKELEARKKQYEFYREQLLSFDENVSLVSLSEIALDMYRGAGIKRDEVRENGTPCVRYGEIYTDYNIWFDKCLSYTDENLIQSKKYFEKNDILFAITGEKVEEISKSCAYIGEEKCLAGGDIVVMKHKQNAKYLSYALSTFSACKQKSSGKVKSKVVHSSIPELKKIKIPLPPLEEQERIVNILDRFDALCNDLTCGLPAEIEARKKQYAYYRDKLLTFKNITENS